MDTSITIQTIKQQESDVLNRIIVELNSCAKKDNKIIDTLTQDLKYKQENISSLENKIERQMAQIEWLKRQVFGKKSERLFDLHNETPILPGFELPEPAEEEPEKIKVPAHNRTKKKKGKGKFTVEYPDDLPRKEIHIEAPKEERTLQDGTEMVKIGEDRVEKLAYKPGEFFIKVFIAPKFSVPSKPGLGVVQEKMPTSILPGSKLDTSFMAYLVEEKFAFHMPLYRIEEKLQGRDIRVTRQLLSQVIVNVGERSRTLVKLMAERTLEQGVIFTDDTPLKIQIKEKRKCKEARIWDYIGGLPNAPPYHIYEFTMDRREEHPITFLQNFKGVFHADAYSAYGKLDKKDGISWAACWAHARRKFERVLTSSSSDFSLHVMRLMRYLFLYERVAWRRSPEERLRIRQTRERPIVDELFNGFIKQIKSGHLLPKSLLAGAIGYMQKRENNFRLYLNNPDLRMSNNTAERGLRKLTIGRKNWLFVGSERAGHAMAALLSLVQTCRAMDIKPQAYLEDLFNRLLDHPHSRLEEFLPDRWQEIQEAKNSEAETD